MECKNCHTLLSENADYCYHCGGKIVRNRLTIRNLFDHFSETFFNYDNKFLQTFIGLFRKPEDVIGCYIEGTRKKYVNVVSYFAIAITISGLQLYILNKFFPDAMDMSVFTTRGGEEFQKQNMSFVQEYQSIIMMLYVPFYALVSRIVFLNKKTFNYTEQLVIYMYIQGQVTIASAFAIVIFVMLGANFGLLTMVTIPVMIGYTAYCLKRLYKLNMMELILKTMIFLIVFTVLSIIILIVILGIMYFTGDLKEMMEAQRAARGT